MPIWTSAVFVCDDCHATETGKINWVRPSGDSYQLPEGWTDTKYWIDLKEERKRERARQREKDGDNLFYIAESSHVWITLGTTEGHKEIHCKECSEKMLAELDSLEILEA